MSILTRLTKDIATNLLPKTQYALDFHDEFITGHPATAYLTFDDGPHPEYTPKVLDALAERNAKATFFILGKHINGSADIIRRAISEGHSVGTHTWNHWNSKETNLKTWIDDALLARKMVEDIIGQPCNLFRPPYGDLTPLALLSLLRNNFQIIQWSLDTKDFLAKSELQLCQWFIDHTPQTGDIILMHDNKKITSQCVMSGCNIWRDIDFKAIPMLSPQYKQQKKKNQGKQLNNA